ncbi:class I SAM-dependent methyltransferase [Algoriphagus machipongonensis]|uniref:Rhamnosyl O-methyltransferase n=1 Tax=Algoriphagus machipongonensis TaxID=388413 RepID=A3HRH3_9BACT|nr:hypothetical protein [Algoriphagus machipongonensis]EAZ82441.1 hypothetical protein ALPR1_09510 [Algoriphagus machipongonensis]
MGIVSFSIPKNLVVKLIEFKKIDYFVETGTYKGGTCFWAAQYFEKVLTIEIDENISMQTSSKHNCPNNIEFFIGNSKDVLPDIVHSRIKNSSSFFWLDGHWCKGGSGKEEECPLLEELDAIKSLKDPVIFIDDARCFLGPLPSPHDSNQWPRVDDIFNKVSKIFPSHRFTIQDDVIMVIPQEYMSVFDSEWKKSFNDRFSNKKSVSLLDKIKNKIKLL